jgi:hypothetical protein
MCHTCRTLFKGRFHFEYTVVERKLDTDIWLKHGVPGLRLAHRGECDQALRIRLRSGLKIFYQKRGQRGALKIRAMLEAEAVESCYDVPIGVHKIQLGAEAVASCYAVPIGVRKIQLKAEADALPAPSVVMPAFTKGEARAQEWREEAYAMKNFF